MTGPLISCEELRGLLDQDADVSVLDVRYRMGGPPGRPAFEAGHVPAAVYVDLDVDLAAAPGAGGRHPLPDPADLQAAMRRSGVRQDRTVVVYDDWSSHAAGRAWWLLRHHGHPDARVLDGGWAAWVASGGPVETGASHVEPGDFDACPGSMSVVDADGLAAVPVVVDARAAERYRGDVEPVDPVAGHVPGAVNVPTSTNLGPDGRFRPVEELRTAYAAAGVDGSQDVAVYCGSGITATHDVLALELLGIRAALYPGSWSGWITDPARAVTSRGLTLRPGRDDDVPGLTVLAGEVWPAAHAVSPGAVEHTIAAWWTPQALRRSLGATRWVLAEREGRVVGAGNVDLRRDVAVVRVLAVLLDEQGRGTATSLLEALGRVAGGGALRLTYLEGGDPVAASDATWGFRKTDRTAADADAPPEVVAQRERPAAT